MPLTFDLRTAKYDAYRKQIRLTAMNGDNPVKCAITLDALAMAEGRPASDRSLPALHRKYAEWMCQIVNIKYRANEFDKFKRIVIAPADLARYGNPSGSEGSSGDIEEPKVLAFAAI